LEKAEIQNENYFSETEILYLSASINGATFFQTWKLSDNLPLTEDFLLASIEPHKMRGNLQNKRCEKSS